MRKIVTSLAGSEGCAVRCMKGILIQPVMPMADHERPGMRGETSRIASTMSSAVDMFCSARQSKRQMTAAAIRPSAMPRIWREKTALGLVSDADQMTTVP